MLNSKGQVDLTVLQNQPDGSLIWILNYQDYFTKSLHLGPLVAMFCTAKMIIVVEDVVECTHSTDRDIECAYSIK